MAKQKKYHFIYKTTCVITNKYYVGMHSTDDLDDGYLGSGKILGYSRRKYGDENHKLEILEYCSSRDELKQLEKNIVNEKMIADSLNMNLKYGGEGGWEHINDGSEKHKLRCSKAGGRGGAVTGAKNLYANPEAMTRGCRLGGQIGGPINLPLMNTAAAKAKRIATFAQQRHAQGERNSQYGTCWVTNGNVPIKIKKELLEEYLVRGYFRGRKMK